MTSAEMLAKVRTILDETTADLWEDSEIYRALTDGQMEVAKLLIDKFKASGKLPFALTGLLKESSGSVSVSYISYGDSGTDVPDFWEIVSLRVDCDKAGGKHEARIMDYNEYLQEYSGGGYWEGTQGTPIAYLYTASTSPAKRIVFEPDADPILGASYILEYLSKPTDIDASTEPVLDETAHNAIVQYAVADLLRKDGRSNEAMGEMNKFMEMIKWL